jgi:hypothetical protein
VQIDGNAARVARREGKGKQIDYTLGDQTFVFPVEYPLSATELTQQAIDEGWPNNRYIRAMLEHLMGSDRWADYLALKPSLDDVNYLYDEIWSAYGLTVGESDSSPDSSATGGESSKPNSNASTTSTPARSSRAKPVRVAS